MQLDRVKLLIVEEAMPPLRGAVLGENSVFSIVTALRSSAIGACSSAKLRFVKEES